MVRARDAAPAFNEGACEEEVLDVPGSVEEYEWWMSRVRESNGLSVARGRDRAGRSSADDAREVFFTDPSKFVPYRMNKQDRWWYGWSIPPDPTEDDGPAAMIRQLMARSRGQSPETQFYNALAELKKAAIQQVPCLEQDFIVEVHMPYTQPRVWRRIRVASTVPLLVLHDQVLAPVMGWARDYHTYQFIDFTAGDGARFGSPKSQAIDMMHLYMHGRALVDAAGVKLGQVVREAGDEAGYVYDLGDLWFHALKVVEVVPRDESAGICTLLDGAMACPPEDGNGNRAYQDKILGPYVAQRGKRVKPALAAKLSEAGAAQNALHRPFEPFAFDLEAARSRLAKALAGPLNTGDRQPHMYMPTNMAGPGGVPIFCDAPRGSHGAGLGAPGRSGGRYGPHGGKFTTAGADESSQGGRAGAKERRPLASKPVPQVVTSRCAACGCANPGMACAGCKTVHYCDRACQRQHWRFGHKNDCEQVAKRREGAEVRTAAPAAA